MLQVDYFEYYKVIYFCSCIVIIKEFNIQVDMNSFCFQIMIVTVRFCTDWLVFYPKNKIISFVLNVLLCFKVKLLNTFRGSI